MARKRWLAVACATVLLMGVVSSIQGKALAYTGYSALARPIRGTEASRAAQALALKFFATLFVDRDIEAALRFVDPDAIRKTGQPGTLAAFLKDPIRARGLPRVTLESIIFFSKSDRAKLQARYPDNLWSKLASWPDDGVLCAAALDIGSDEEIPLVVILVKQVNGQPKVVFWDDN